MDKVVEFVSRILEHLSLHFYQFSMNSYEFSNSQLSVYVNFCRLPHGNQFLNYKGVLGRSFRAGEAIPGRIPARRLAGGEG